MKSNISTNNNNTSPFPSSLSYEPTSVLDPRATSSPASAQSTTTIYQCKIPPPPTSIEESDTLSWLFNDKDTLSPPFKSLQLNFSDDPLDFFEPNVTSITNEYNHLESVVQASRLIETGDLPSAHMLLTQLNQHFPKPSGQPLSRAGFYFKEALLSALSPNNQPSDELAVSSSELVCRIHAQRLFSDLSPIPQFSSFSANQTILEALDSIGTTPSIHIIDFDLGLGGQWSSFSQAVAARSYTSQVAPPTIRLTAVVQTKSPETTLASENLRDFAQNLGLRFSIDLIFLSTIGFHALNQIHLEPGEPVAIVLSPAKLCIKNNRNDPYTPLLRFLRCALPKVIVSVDLDWFTGPSLSQSVAIGLEYYGNLMESIQAATVSTGRGEEAAKRVEWGLVRGKINGVIQYLCSHLKPFQEMISRASLKPVRFSDNAVTQAQWLIHGAPIHGYHVERRDASLVLSWHGKDLVVTSAWRS
ncbi:hypothetical protein LUZ60_006505 [Juncus effusus]|nr:hypothetical protein LUZ60_006505 [Juncus effusus]